MRESHQLALAETFPAHGARTNRTRAIARTSPIVWLNLICLDAPIVAITWQWSFARSFHFSLTIASQAALFLTAWLIYLTDRLADTWALRAEQPRSLRQKFCGRHQYKWMVTIAAIALGDLWVIFRYLDHATIRVGVLIGGFALVYLAVNYWLGKIWRFIPVKEICIGALFALGTAATFFARSDFSLLFAATFLLFAALCSLNCIGIAIWERDLDHAQHKDSIATRWSGIRSCYLPSAFGLAFLGLAIALWTKAPVLPNVCLGLSAALLGVLDWLGDRIQGDERTALADLVLLTPLFVLAFQLT